MSASLIEVRNATRLFGSVRALDDVSISLNRAETLGVVGESGSGKSTLGRAIVGLQPLSDGDIRIDGQSLSQLSAKALRTVRARIQMVFQDPAGSLNPRHTIGRILEEPLIVHRRGDSVERRERVAWAMARVGLLPEMARRYPAEFSGGQRQRISIARALILAPDIIICDEAVSGLDVSVRAQILNLLSDLRAELGLACMFISHDLAVVRHMSERIAVLYSGRIIEQGPSSALWERPFHPYTRLLMESAPSMKNIGQIRRDFSNASKGNDPSPAGCTFRLLCPLASEACSQAAPILRKLTGGRQLACHNVAV